MDKCINVAVTGYYRTGSSAVVDLLKEYKNVQIVPYNDKAYEHNLFYHSGGLFEVCSLLTHGNNEYTSDVVVSRFITEMKRLNDYNYVWFGSYKKMFGDKFMNIVYEFADSISTKKERKSANHILKTRFSLAKLMAQIALLFFKGKKFINPGIWYVYDKEECYCALPSHDELYKAAKKFTSSYFSLFNSKNENELKIYDHLIWPSQIDEFAECFEENFKCIVVERDPRDLYILEKYMPDGKIPNFPTNPDEFSRLWNKVYVSHYVNKNVLKINFEDLIYRYEDTVDRIEMFLNLSSENHINKREYFNPDASIENTQVYRINKDWFDEASRLSGLLEDKLYKFPYERVPNRELMFVDNGIGKSKI